MYIYALVQTYLNVYTKIRFIYFFFFISSRFTLQRGSNMGQVASSHIQGPSHPHTYIRHRYQIVTVASSDQQCIHILQEPLRIQTRVRFREKRDFEISFCCFLLLFFPSVFTGPRSIEAICSNVFFFNWEGGG